MTTGPVLYLLDTNIVIHYARGMTVGQQIESDHGLLATPSRPLISVVTRGEAYAFAVKRTWGPAKIAALDALLSQFVTIDINHSQLILAYATLDAWSQNRGRKMGKNDLWIAATAKVTSAALLTTDADFDHMAGVQFQVRKIDQQTGATS